MFRDQFTDPVPPDPQGVCLRRVPEGLDMAIQQENPEKGLLMVGAVAGGILVLVLLVTFFGGI